FEEYEGKSRADESIWEHGGVRPLVNGSQLIFRHQPANLEDFVNSDAVPGRREPWDGSVPQEEEDLGRTIRWQDAGQADHIAHAAGRLGRPREDHPLGPRREDERKALSERGRRPVPEGRIERMADDM